MFNTTNNIDAKPDWETFYDPKLVGEYINSLSRNIRMTKLLNFLAKGIVSYAQHLKQMDDMKAEHELKLAMLRRSSR